MINLIRLKLNNLFDCFIGLILLILKIIIYNLQVLWSGSSVSPWSPHRFCKSIVLSFIGSACLPIHCILISQLLLPSSLTLISYSPWHVLSTLLNSCWISSSWVLFFTGSFCSEECFLLNGFSGSFSMSYCQFDICFSCYCCRAFWEASSIKVVFLFLIRHLLRAIRVCFSRSFSTVLSFCILWTVRCVYTPFTWFFTHISFWSATFSINSG